MTDLRIVTLGERVVAVDKPHGMLTIPGRLGSGDPRPCLIHELSRTVPGKLWIVHRLDREVAGLVLFARDADAHRTLGGWFERRAVRKSYEAWTEGDPGRASLVQGTWQGRLIRGRRRVHEGDRGRDSVTEARCTGSWMHCGEPVVTWELSPRTGRPHQLRCQAASRGFPILGDALYGATRPFAPQAIALRATRLAFPGATREELDRLGLPEDLQVEPLSALVREDS